MRDRPEDIGLRRYGQRAMAARAARPADGAGRGAALRDRHPAFWVLAGTFFICGASTNGLIGTHLIAACHDYGISRSACGGAAGDDGDLRHPRHDGVGLADGSLFEPSPAVRLLRAARRVAAVPAVTRWRRRGGLGWFAVFYGLDWVATVPPTVRLTSDAFGRENTGVIFGWIGASHQLGASMAALGAGAIRSGAGDYSRRSGLPARCAFSPAPRSSRRPPRAAPRPAMAA